jgi:hypothetical protein
MYKSTFHHYEKTHLRRNLKGRKIWADVFRDFSPWSDDSIGLGLWESRSVEVEEHGELLTSWKPGRRWEIAIETEKTRGTRGGGGSWRQHISFKAMSQ